MPEQALILNHSPLENVRFNYIPPEVSDSRAEILKGLSQAQKEINPKFFYDTAGSELFENITEAPEYYPTRTERKILTDNAESIAQWCEPGCVLIEPGSGSSEKVRLLLDAVRPSHYVPMDISAEFLHRSAVKLGQEFPWLEVNAVCADFSGYVPASGQFPSGKRVVFYPGSTLGNMTPQRALDFLKKLNGWLSPKGGVLIGIDLHKDKATLEAAYNDQKGLTARFNLNALSHINRIANANFELGNFRHLAFYNETLKRIEMHLVSRIDHIVRVGDSAIALAEGERIHTENSYKYTLEGFDDLIQQAGLTSRKVWCDVDQLFSLHYLEL